MAILSMRQIDKQFAGQYANHGVDFSVEAGEVHALLGENGAGKTTLMNILYGLYRRDGGTVIWQGEEVDFHSPRDAIERQIGMVHQHFMLVPTLTVSQNITLGLREKGYPFTRRGAIDAKIKELAARYGLPVEPEACTGGLSVGEQQRVEILKLLYRGARLLILDEPTAVLTPQETQGFFEVLNKLKADGCSVILITHRIPEVMEIADRVTVLRDTRSIITAPIGDLTEIRLSEHMIGRPLHPPTRPAPARQEGEGLELRGLYAEEKGVPVLQAVDLSIRPGQVLGLAGVDGNGQKPLAEAVVGIRKILKGSIRLNGEELSHRKVAQRKARGMAYISDDRHRDGLVMPMDLVDNLFLKFSGDKRYQNKGLLSYRRMRAKAGQAVESYHIKAHSLETPISHLSGGNQQKLILARELSDEPGLIVAFQPTRGLDVGAAEFIQEQLLAHRARGACILLISADLEEILALSDRIAVIHEGKIMGLMENGDGVDTTALGLMMAGRAQYEESPAGRLDGAAGREGALQ